MKDRSPIIPVESDQPGQRPNRPFTSFPERRGRGREAVVDPVLISTTVTARNLGGRAGRGRAPRPDHGNSNGSPRRGERRGERKGIKFNSIPWRDREGISEFQPRQAWQFPSDFNRAVLSHPLSDGGQGKFMSWDGSNFDLEAIMHVTLWQEPKHIV